MFYRLRARKLARHFSRELQRSIVDCPVHWSIVPHPPEARITQIAKGEQQKTVVTIQPSKQLPAIRIFDRLSVAYDGADVWLPLLHRIRIKNAVRLWILRRRLQLPLT